METYKAICKQCGKEKWIQNKRGICPDCVYLNRHGETRFEAQIRKKKEKEGRQPMKTKKTGEKVVFEQIWREREHVCHNCLQNLGHEPKPYMFMHLKSKGAYPELRLEKTNIELACWDCHYAYDHQGIEKYNERKNGK